MVSQHVQLSTAHWPLSPAPAMYAERPRVAVQPAQPGRSIRYPLLFEGVAGVVASGPLLGIRRRSYVEVTDVLLIARFGPWSVETPLDNVLSAAVGGPYRPVDVIGPPRVSLADGGLTFATNLRKGVCIRFYDPVRGIEPSGRVRHPSLTVTVADCEALMKQLRPRPDR